MLFIELIVSMTIFYKCCFSVFFGECDSGFSETNEWASKAGCIQTGLLLVRIPVGVQLHFIFGLFGRFVSIFPLVKTHAFTVAPEIKKTII